MEDVLASSCDRSATPLHFVEQISAEACVELDQFAVGASIEVWQATLGNFDERHHYNSS